MAVVWRTDTRHPGIFANFGCMPAHAPMAAGQARMYLMDFLRFKTPLDFKFYAHVTGRPELLATAAKRDTGGKAHQWYYEMEIPGSLWISRDWSKATGLQLGKAKALWPTLLLDKSTLSGAEHIAVYHKSGTREVTFLTSIPYSWIKKYKGPGTGGWKKMPILEEAQKMKWI